MTDPADMDALVVREARAIRDKAKAIQKAMASIAVHMSSRGGELSVTVDAAGRTKDIQITPKAMSLGERRLAQALLETLALAQRQAAQEAASAATPLTSDRRVADTMTKIRAVIDSDEPADQPARPKTEAEIQAADDEYFERMNRRGWR